ncbi:hypothetical protein MMC25_006687 [Agyrium rufum]|nr:hypothetical protein [Agyrium rufum]
MEAFKRWQRLRQYDSYLQQSQDGEKDPYAHETTQLDINYRHDHANLQRQSRRMTYLTVVNLIIFLITIGLNGSRYVSWPSPSNHIAKAISYYSPVLSEVEVTFHDTLLNGTLWPSEHPSFARQAPNPEMEKMWKKYENFATFPITKEQVIQLGKDPMTAAKFEDEEWGFGDDAYIASLDLVHQIHCLNRLRKAAFATYDQSTTAIEQEHDHIWWIHVQHCTDMLLQNIMCHADADVATYNWMDTQPVPFPDFSVNKRCRNFDALVDWQDEHSVDMAKYAEIKRPANAKIIPAEPGYYEMFGYGDSVLFPNGEGATSTGGQQSGGSKEHHDLSDHDHDDEVISSPVHTHDHNGDKHSHPDADEEEHEHTHEHTHEHDHEHAHEHEHVDSPSDHHVEEHTTTPTLPS